MSGILLYFPRPFSDIGSIVSETPVSTHWTQHPNLQKIAYRLAFVAFQFFLYYHFQVSLSKVVCLGIVCSLPATTLAGGITLFEIARKSIFESLTTAFACLAAGYYLLERYDILQMGFLERFLPRETVSKTSSGETWIDPHLFRPYMSQDMRLRLLVQTWKNEKRFQVFEEDENHALGVFNYQSILSSGKLDSQDVVEFFYTYADMERDLGDACQRGCLTTGGNKQQIYYSCLNNAFNHSFVCDGLLWKSREHYFQAQKFKEGSETYRAIQNGEGAFACGRNLRKELQGDAYKSDLRLQTVEQWQQWDKLEAPLVAYHANFSYFSQHQEQRDLLLSTGSLPLVERNPVPDRWGITFATEAPAVQNKQGKRINRNLQGWILMVLRVHLA